MAFVIEYITYFDLLFIMKCRDILFASLRSQHERLFLNVLGQHFSEWWLSCWSSGFGFYGIDIINALQYFECLFRHIALFGQAWTIKALGVFFNIFNAKAWQLFFVFIWIQNVFFCHYLNSQHVGMFSVSPFHRHPIQCDHFSQSRHYNRINFNRRCRPFQFYHISMESQPFEAIVASEYTKDTRRSSVFTK